jgi:hypothetical protein
MKKICLILLFAIVFVLNTASMCSSDDSTYSQNPNDVVNTMLNGTWVITNFNEDGVDNTSNFSGFTFTFGSANLLTATNGSENYSGFWSVTNDDSSDDSPSSSGVDFNIVFGAPANFVELSDDWDVIERTATKIRLRHISGGDGSTDLLTFEIN